MVFGNARRLSMGEEGSTVEGRGRSQHYQTLIPIVLKYCEISKKKI